MLAVLAAVTHASSCGAVNSRLGSSGALIPHARVCFVRHGESEHNFAKKFTGWLDGESRKPDPAPSWRVLLTITCANRVSAVPLTEGGRQEARAAAELLSQRGHRFDVAFTSKLGRAQETLDIMLELLNATGLSCETRVVSDYRLNERHYGQLQGVSKAAAVEKWGREAVLSWRNSFSGTPPPLPASDPGHPSYDPLYADLPREALPDSECLRDTLERALPFWEECVVPELQAGRNVLISAHAHSIRSLVKALDGIADDDISRVSIPNALPLLFELDDNLMPLPPRVRALDGCGLPSMLNAEFLGDASELSSRLDRDAAVVGLECPLPPPLAEDPSEGIIVEEARAAKRSSMAEMTGCMALTMEEDAA